MMIKNLQRNQCGSGVVRYYMHIAVLDPVSLNWSNDEIIQWIVEECNYNDGIIACLFFFIRFNILTFK